MSWIRLSLWFAITAAFFISGSRAAAEQPDALAIDQVQIGFGGVYKVGHWTPLAITLRSSQNAAVSGELIVQLDDGDGIATTVRERDVTLPAGEESIVQAVVKPGRPQGPVDVAFNSNKGVAARTFAEDALGHAGAVCGNREADWAGPTATVLSRQQLGATRGGARRRSEVAPPTQSGLRRR
jgi:hypothetical protein